MSGSCIAERLEHYLSLTDRERSALARLEENERSVRRGTIVRRENDRGTDLLIIKSGWMFSHVLLDDGSRQISRLHFPGDMVGASALAFLKATDSLVALTDVRFAGFDKSMLRDLFEAHPRIAAALFAFAQAESVALTDRIASLGRTSAKARVAALLLDTVSRLRVMDKQLRNRFAFPLTQEEIGDVTGLTAVHVNRMMRALVEDRLIRRSNSHIEVIDEPKMSRLANYTDRYAELDTNWLPAPR
jgi:CRP/FNR family transcriptional regulator